MSKITSRALCGAALSLIAFTLPLQANAHAIIGDRVFPVTLAVDDPGVSDEMTLPQVTALKQKDDDGSTHWESDAEFELDKRLTSNLAVSVGGAYVDDAGTHGWDNFSAGVKYVALTNAEHEIMISTGLDWDIGGTGANHIGESFSTLTPQVFFGKGFGDISSDPFNLLRPFAITGQLGYSMPTERHSGGETNPDTFNWGFTLQYSIPYLQQHVKDYGIAAPFNNIVPVIEFAMQTPVNNDDGSGHTTGTINPGFIWSGRDSQFGLEAVLPVNSDSGHGVGVTAQAHFFFDDMFPSTLGKPIW